VTLIAHYRCDTQDDDDPTLYDVSGHPNNHDVALTLFSTSWGFDHLRINANGNVYGGPANPGDFALTGEMTIMCWIQRMAVMGPTYDEWVAGYGNTTLETQADNHLWGFINDPNDAFGMYWEYGAGIDVKAMSPSNALDIAGDGFRGMSRAIHIACIRTINGANRDVKFVRNGVDLGSDVTGLTPPDGGGNGGPWFFAYPKTSNVGRIAAAIADIRIYDSAESVATILGIYNSEKARHEHATRGYNEILAFGTRWSKDGESGSIYTPHNTGTRLNEDEGRNLAGWVEEWA
jgi:hypothetical protein